MCVTVHIFYSIKDNVKVMHSWEIEIKTQSEKQFISIDKCLEVSTFESDFYIKSVSGLHGTISLDGLNKIIKVRPEIVDGKAIELKQEREEINVLSRYAV